MGLHLSKMQWAPITSTALIMATRLWETFTFLASMRYHNEQSLEVYPSEFYSLCR